MTDDVAEKRLYSEIIDLLDTCTKCFMYASNLELAIYTPDSKVSKYSTSLIQPSPHLKLSQTSAYMPRKHEGNVDTRCGVRQDNPSIRIGLFRLAYTLHEFADAGRS